MESYARRELVGKPEAVHAPPTFLIMGFGTVNLSGGPCGKEPFLFIGSRFLASLRRMMSLFTSVRQLRGLVLLFTLLLLSASCWASQVAGSVVGFQYLENPIWSKAKEPKEKGYSFREVVPTVPAKYRKLSPDIEKELCIAVFAEGKQGKMKDMVISLGGGRATPITLVVTPGTKLTFENKDPFTHRLYGVGLNTFTAADSSAGSKREWTVPKAGTYEIRDERAPSLRVWVIAHENLVSSTYPQPSGTFDLALQRSGTYEVQAYFSGKKIGKAQAAIMKGRRLKLKPIVVATAKKEKK